MKKLLQIHLTDKCNLRCKHCYQEGTDHNRNLNKQDFKILMEQFKELEKASGGQGRVVNITGGEPLTVLDIMEYLDIAIKSGIEKINFLTNGLLFNKKILLELKRRRIIEIQVSLEGPKEINDIIRGVGTFDKIIKNISLAHSLGIDVKVSYTLNGLNYQCIAETIKQVKDAGAKAIWFDRMIPFAGNDLPAISTKQFVEALKIIKAEKDRYSKSEFKVLMKRGLQFLYDTDKDGCYRCGGIIKNLTVMPDGTVYPCRRMPIKIGNFKENTLREIYQADSTQKLMKKICSYPDECKACVYKEGCRGGLKCLNYSVKGDLENSDINCPIKDNLLMCNINTVYLMMGTACNFHCNYCIQTDSCIKTKPVISELTKKYIHNLINIRPVSKQKLNLMFWGGEPLLYLDVIKSVIKEFGQTIRYSMVTNGSLLTEKIVDYINENNISVALSFDGENTIKTRNVDVLANERIRELFLKINDKSICAVTSSYNYDYRKLYEYVEELVGNVYVNIENLKVNWEMPKEYFDIDIKDFQSQLHELAQQAVSDILNLNMSRSVQLFLPYLQGLCNENDNRIVCGQMYSCLNIDLEGNVYSCHNLCDPIGTVNDNYQELINRQENWIANHALDICKECDVYRICKGGCPNEILNEKGEKYSCKYQRVFFREVMWIEKTLNKYLNVYPIDSY